MAKRTGQGHRLSVRSGAVAQTHLLDWATRRCVERRCQRRSATRSTSGGRAGRSSLRPLPVSTQQTPRRTTRPSGPREATASEHHPDCCCRPIASAPVGAGAACYQLGANARSACAFVRHRGPSLPCATACKQRRRPGCWRPDRRRCFRLISSVRMSLLARLRSSPRRLASRDRVGQSVSRASALSAGVESAACRPSSCASSLRARTSPRL
jgi:hypothetical protein